ncbi:AMIN domain-containing protein [bacterium]|nr:AMIN domain-containing protein [bacterium]
MVAVKWPGFFLRGCLFSRMMFLLSNGGWLYYKAWYQYRLQAAKCSRRMPRTRLLIIGVLMLVAGLLWPAAGHASALRNLRFITNEGGHRIVMELDSEPDSYRVFTLDNPDRLVIDLVKTSWQAGDIATYKHPLLFSQLRKGIQNGTDLRVVMDMVNVPTISDVTLLEPEQKGQPYQVLVDVGQPFPKDNRHAEEEEKPVTRLPPSPDTLGRLDFEDGENKMVSHGGAATKVGPWAQTPTPTPKPGMPAFAAIPIIAIDAGHGGADPGAASRHGVREKELTFAFAKQLQEALNKTGKVKAVLTRQKDVFIPLRERIAIARKHKAHLFMSVHADSAPNRLTRGLSVYTLSDAASDKEAELLAARENKVDIIGGLDLSKQSDDVTGILIDLAQRDTRAKSSVFADAMIDSLLDSTLLVKNAHRYAGFAVLKAPDVPSVLVELGFLSNDEDERMLRAPGYRTKLVEAMVKAVLEYFKQYPPVNGG